MSWFGPIFLKLDHANQTATLEVRGTGREYSTLEAERWRRQARAAVPAGYKVVWVNGGDLWKR
jgi:hypothetical protein